MFNYFPVEIKGTICLHLSLWLFVSVHSVSEERQVKQSQIACWFSYTIDSWNKPVVHMLFLKTLNCFLLCLWRLFTFVEKAVRIIFELWRFYSQLQSVSKCVTVWSWSELSLLFCHLLKKGLPFTFPSLFSSLLWHYVANSFQIDCLNARFTEHVIYMRFYGQSNDFSHHSDTFVALLTAVIVSVTSIFRICMLWLCPLQINSPLLLWRVNKVTPQMLRIMCM